MGLLIHLSVLIQVAVLAAAAFSSSSVRVTDPYIVTLWNACLSTCESTNPSDWDFYPDLRILKSCSEPMLFNLVVSNPAGTTAPNLRQSLYACSAANVDKAVSTPSASAPQYSTKSVQMETAWRGEEASQYSSHAEVVAQFVQSQLHAPTS